MQHRHNANARRGVIKQHAWRPRRPPFSTPASSLPLSPSVAPVFSEGPEDPDDLIMGGRARLFGDAKPATAATASPAPGAAGTSGAGGAAGSGPARTAAAGSRAGPHGAFTVHTDSCGVGRGSSQLVARSGTGIFAWGRRERAGGSD